MGVKETIKDASGKTLGYRVERGPLTIVEDASGKQIGRFDRNTNKTFDKSGKAAYSGDQTSALFGGD